MYTYKFPMFSVCSDIAVICNDEVLTIVRGTEPFIGHLALVGGHLNQGEDTRTCAIRELKEETGISIDYDNPNFVFVNLFSDPNRDPSGNKLSALYAYYCDLKPNVVASDDAIDYKWIKLSEVCNGAVKAFDHEEMIFQAFERQ